MNKINNWLMLFQGALCQCVSLHPEVSNEGEVRGDGGSGHQRDARRERRVPGSSRTLSWGRSSTWTVYLSSPSSLPWTFPQSTFSAWMSRALNWASFKQYHGIRSTLASQRWGAYLYQNLMFFYTLQCILGQTQTFYCIPRHIWTFPFPSMPILTQSFERLTSAWCWLNFLTLTRMRCWIWWTGLAMTTPSTFERTCFLWKEDPDVYFTGELPSL